MPARHLWQTLPSLYVWFFCLLYYILSSDLKLEITLKATYGVCPEDNPCKNGGICMDSDPVFKCICHSDYYGILCDRSKLATIHNLEMQI
jgi:hypothetical protein